MRIKQSYITYIKNHKDSRGNSAPYVIKSHETGKILSSHSTKSEAESHLRDMHIHGGSLMNFKEITTFDDLVKQAEELNIPKEELQKGIDVEKEHTDTITNLYQDLAKKEPSEKEISDAAESIVIDHEKETVDLVKEPVYYKDYLIPMENTMKEDAKEGTFKNYSSIEELIKTAQDPFEEEEKESFPEGPTKERRFRVEMYVDIFVPETDDLEADRGKATEIAEEAARKLGREVGEAYVAKAYHHPVGGGLLGGELTK